jgi:hypothetical protein
VAAIVLAAAIVMRQPTKAFTNPGTTIFSETCNCRLVTIRQAAPSANFAAPLEINVAWQTLGPQTEIVRAYLGYVSDSNSPQQSLLTLPTSLNITLNSASVGSIVPKTTVVSTTNSRRVYTQYIDATQLFRSRGTGRYAITNHVGAGWSNPFAAVILRDPSFPLTQLAISDWVFGQEDNSLDSTSASVSLPAFPEGYHYAYGNPSILLMPGTTDPLDIAQGSFVMGSASGPLPNQVGSTAIAGSFWCRLAWCETPVPNPDPQATRFTLNIVNTVSDGGADVVTFLTFRGILEPDAPLTPVVVTDTCYDEE